MAIAQPLPAPPTRPVQQPKAAGGNEAAAEQALIPSPPQQEEEDLIELKGPLGRSRGAEVAVPRGSFGFVICWPLARQVDETQWAHGEDLPLAAGNVQLAWSEFEVVDAQLAVRITRLA